MTLAEKIKDNKAVYTGAGLVDYVAEQARKAPGEAKKLQEKYRGTVTDNYGTAKVEVNDAYTKARATVIARLEEVKANVAKVQEKTDSGSIQAYLSEVTTTVNKVIDELAERGKHVINKAADEVVVEAREAKSVEAPAPAPKAAPKPVTAPKPKPAAAKKPAPAKKDV